MAVTSIGIGSNLPLATLLENLEKAENTKLTAVKDRLDVADAKISGYGSYKSALEAYQKAAKALASNDTWGSIKTSLGTSGIIGITGSAKAAEGNYTVTVKQLAQSHTVAAKGVANQNTVVGTGTLTFEFGKVSGFDKDTGTYVDPEFTPTAGSTKTVTIDTSTNSLQGIRDAINKADIGVTASIVNDGSGTPYRLVMTSKETGETSTMRITGSTPALNGAIGYDPEAVTQPSGATETQRGTNANLTINGLEFNSKSNTLTEAIPGATVNAVAVGTTTLKLTKDTAAMTTAVENFVKAYNTLQTTVADLTSFDTEEGTNAALTGDSTVRGIQVQMRNILSTSEGGSDAVFNLLGEIGVSFQLDGTMAVDNDKLATAMTDNLAGVQKLFAGDGATGGVARAIDKSITEATRTGGMLSLAQEGVKSQVGDLKDLYTVTQDRIAATMERYNTQFKALDLLVSQMNQTSSYLTQQFDAMSGSSK